MNPVRWKYLAAAFLASSLIFLASTYYLPTLKVNQNLSYPGPVVPYYGGDTSLSGYYVPPVAAGTTVTFSFYNFLPGTVEISIFPTQTNDISPVGPVVYDGTLLTGGSYAFRSNSSQAYGLYVISHNNTSYLLVINATFSPYFWLNAYTSIGVMACIASFILLYYYNFTSRRWRLEQRAIQEARGEAVK